MKLVQSLFVAALVAVPALSFAQSNHTLTRAEVRAELFRLEKAGYNPASDNTQYPGNIEAAQMRLKAQSRAAAPSAASSYGGTEKGASASGSPTPTNATRVARQGIVGFASIYDHS